MVLVGGDRGELGVGDGDLRVGGREFQVLHVLLGAVVAAREREDQGFVALQLAELAGGFGVVGELVVGKGGAGDDVGAHSGRTSVVVFRGKRRTFGDPVELGAE